MRRTFEDVAEANRWSVARQYDVLRRYVEHQQDEDALTDFAEDFAANVPDVDYRWALASPAFQAEAPWCGWTMAFAHGSDWDTTGFGLERLVNINILLTTADGRSRPVSMTAWHPAYDGSADQRGGIVVRELDTVNYEPINPSREELIPYEDIREIVVY